MGTARTNPYSIKPNGDVVKAFRKRGWVWGENFLEEKIICILDLRKCKKF